MDFQKKEWKFNDLILESELNRHEAGIEEGILKAERAQADIDAHITDLDPHPQYAKDGDPQPPTPHASTHASGGSDPITPGMIGAETPAGAQAKANQAKADAIAWVQNYGLGVNVPAITDANALSGIGDTGFYKVDGTTLNTPSQAGVLLHFGRDSRPVQIYIDYLTNKTYTRTYTSIGWTSWAELAKLSSGVLSMPGNINMNNNSLTSVNQIIFNNGSNLGETAGQRFFISAEADRFDVTTDDGQNYILTARYASNIFQFKGNNVWHSGNLMYEEGDWTPVLKGGTTAGNPTYTTRLGKYIKIGSLVYAFGRIVISSKGGMTGNVTIGGLPFVSRIYCNGMIGYSSGITFMPNTQQLAFVVSGADALLYWVYGNGASSSAVQDTSISDSFSINFTLIYENL